MSDADLPSKNNRYYSALTGLRAVVAFLVFAYHYVKSMPTDTLPLLSRWAIRLLQQGHIGVAVFFVLSGFLITTRYLDGVKLTGAWFRRYLQNRFARIYPIYFLLTALTFAVMIIRPEYDWDEWPRSYQLVDRAVVLLTNLTLTRGYFEDLWLLGVGTAWSLTIEESFYLFAPFLLLGLQRNMRRFLYYPIILIGVGALLVFFCRHFLPYYHLMGSINFMLLRTFFGRCTEFFVGIGLAFWIKKSGEKRQHNNPVARYTWLGIAGVGLCMLGMAYNDHRPLETIQEYNLVHIPLSNLVLPFPVAILLWGLISEPTWVQRLLQTKAFDLLGKSSYVFYLIHQGVVADFVRTHISEHWLGLLLVFIALSITLYTLVEKPLHRLLRAKPQTAPIAFEPQPLHLTPPLELT